MTRTSLSWLAIALALGGYARGADIGPKPKPSILHIHADDHRPDGLGALGNPHLKTPNLDQLVNSGMTFTHCYTQGSMIGAVCLPSRTMLLTGRSWLRIPGGRTGRGPTEPVAVLPSVLGAAGYETFHAGKGGNEFRAGIEAFDHNLVMDDRGDSRATSSQRHADAAIQFLRDRPQERPFYIYLAPPVPHDPRIAPQEFMDLYDPAQLPLPAAFLPLHPFDNGELTVRDEHLAPWPRTPENTRRQIADYYACISCLDHHVGRIFQTLRELGQFDQTIIIFTGDNGLSLGEHGLFGKQNLYEFGGMHVPLVVAGPGIPQGRTDALVYLLDLFPTFCDFASAAVPDGVEGKSLAPVIVGKTTKVREYLYTGYRDCQRAVRDDRWKLIRYPLVNQTQLFDLQSDPREMQNRAADPVCAAKVAEMMTLLKHAQQEYGDDFPLTVANPKDPAWSPPGVERSSPERKPNQKEKRKEKQQRLGRAR
ncbi:MAG: sulfatase-like hydrolase/transferase [Planctomycetota bacterium]|nr:sulfatase-like hydrolase/transferase [Planctomycetota bacterium]